MDEMINVKILNCNCISSANIEIKPNVLNIKYGCNGTGKTSISRAIYAKVSNDDNLLERLRPYTNDDTEENKTKVEGLNFTKVRVFDESYVNSYLFTESSFLENSFQVFLKSTEGDDLTEKISNLMADLLEIFESTKKIEELRTFLPSYFQTVKYENDNLSVRGGVGEFLKGNGCGFNNYGELDSYKPFYENREFSKVSNWAKWRNAGIKEMNGCSCPFCTSNMELEKIKTQNNTIAKVFKKSALATANAILEYVEKAVECGFIDAEVVNILNDYIGNPSKSDSLRAELKQLAAETEYLISKIDKICSFKPMNITKNELAKIEIQLEEMILDFRQLTKFYKTSFIEGLISMVNSKVEVLKENTGTLKGLFFQHDRKIEVLIKNKKDDINNFFELAGFPYKFVIKPNGEEKALSYLVPNNLSEDDRVTELEKRLSWGEKNAFSLVMFMFESISDGADLIILDDPITSFDKDKKFAVIRRLFDNQKSSFRDKTVVMFTHDLQPIIDYVHGNFFTRLGLTTPVQAKWLQNQDGNIVEYNIESDDLLNTVELTKNIAVGAEYEIPIRVVNLRKHIELTIPNYSQTEIYDVLSNLIHGRVSPLSGDGEDLESHTIEKGVSEINRYINDCTYESLIDEMHSQKLFNLINEDNIYNKIIAVRLLFESDRFNLLSKLRKVYPSTCKYVNETNHVENDYIFQLNPHKFFSIPECYLSQLNDFIVSEKKSLGI